MIEKSSYCHQRYSNKVENVAFTKQIEMEVLVSKGIILRWSLYGHFDYPLEPIESHEKK
ncbi:hypothetical protein R4Z10_10660 [Niallia sp. XMNu-256]|uniref:hypothetical protein n=1 Tax=Niallia sp. XMNu-256 TaxID=3082444 RepID=UPI0030CEFC8D